MATHFIEKKYKGEIKTLKYQKKYWEEKLRGKIEYEQEQGDRLYGELMRALAENQRKQAEIDRLKAELKDKEQDVQCEKNMTDYAQKQLAHAKKYIEKAVESSKQNDGLYGDNIKRDWGMVCYDVQQDLKTAVDPHEFHDDWYTDCGEDSDEE